MVGLGHSDSGRALRKWLFLSYLFGCLLVTGSSQEQVVPVRLIGGSTSREGRVEVFHENEWGTVCDDVFDGDNNGCTVVCNQLGYSGGQISKAYGPGTDRIWMDDVKCLGDEQHLGECMRGFWGQSNCDHKEDVGCWCEPSSSGDGGCNITRHRIRPFDAQYPGIGRVEVQDESGQWMTICDDHWDDNGAAVFCQCLGFGSPKHFRAYWNGRMVDLNPSLPIGYDAVHCAPADRRQVINLWDCAVIKATAGRCRPAKEAAAVACQEVPKATPPGAPTITLECDGQIMTACFESSEQRMRKDLLSIEPSCRSVTTREAQDGVCLDVKMDSCETSFAETDSSRKHYCYDVSYSEYDSNPTVLQMGEIWLRRSCCSVAKNGSVATHLMPRTASHSSRTLYTTANTTFSLLCYTDPGFQAEPLTPLTELRRGQDLFCKIEVATWDPSLFLIVPACHLHATPWGAPSYSVMHNKCPNADALDMTYFSFDGHSWGFQLTVPRFQGHDDLYVSCDTYVCDVTRDPKPYCDRSCVTDGAPRMRGRRTLARQDAVVTEKVVVVSQGPYAVRDTGCGPLISSNGSAHNGKPTMDAKANSFNSASIYSLPAALTTAVILAWSMETVHWLCNEGNPRV